MKIAVTSGGAPQFAQANIGATCGFKYLDAPDFAGIASYDPDVLILGGWYVGNFSDYWMYKALVGSIPRVVILWFGTDMILANGFKKMGEKRMFEELKNEARFLHVPDSREMKENIEGEFGFEMTRPLVTPVEKVLEEMPLPETPVIGIYTPLERMDFYQIDKCIPWLGKNKNQKVIFFHWQVKSADIPYIGRHETRFGLTRGEYERTIGDCSVLLRTPIHDGTSVGAAEFLMAGRPVISTHDLPNWPRWIKGDLTEQKLNNALERWRGMPRVSGKVMAETRRIFDPMYFKAEILSMILETWPELEVDEQMDTTLVGV